MSSKLFCALDTTDVKKALAWANALAENIDGFKVGMALFYAGGISTYKAIAAYKKPLFLDLKLHDIPNTIEGALNGLLDLNPALLTLHTLGGLAMLERAVNLVRKRSECQTRLLGVTALTSLGDEDSHMIGLQGSINEQVVRLASLASLAQLDGVVCSPQELVLLRNKYPSPFLLVTPGIRPKENVSDKARPALVEDQKRFSSPYNASKAGADILVLGRSLTEQTDPLKALKNIKRELMESQEISSETM